MTRFIQADFPTEHAGITRVIRGLTAARQLDVTLTSPVLAVLAFIGAPLRQLGAKVGSRFAAWSVARQQRAADDKLWTLALTDARVMADLSRAMSAEAQRPVRSYY